MESLNLTQENWRNEIRQLVFEEKLPQEVGSLLESLLGIAFAKRRLIPPSFSNREITLLQEHVSDIIKVDGVFYQITVYVPDDSEKNRRFVFLTIHYPHGRLVPLREVRTLVVFAQPTQKKGESV